MLPRIATSAWLGLLRNSFAAIGAPGPACSGPTVAVRLVEDLFDGGMSACRLAARRVLSAAPVADAAVHWQQMASER